MELYFIQRFSRDRDKYEELRDGDGNSIGFSSLEGCLHILRFIENQVSCQTSLWVDISDDFRIRTSENRFYEIVDGEAYSIDEDDEDDEEE